MDKIFIVQAYPMSTLAVQEPGRYERFARKELEHEGKNTMQLQVFKRWWK